MASSRSHTVAKSKTGWVWWFMTHSYLGGWRLKASLGKKTPFQYARTTRLWFRLAQLLLAPHPLHEKIYQKNN
jgi:hypothetical protein